MTVNVRCHVRFEDAAYDPYQGVQLIKMNQRKSWVAIDDYQDGACSSGKGSWNSWVGTGVACPHDRRCTVLTLLVSLLEGTAGSAAQTATIKTITLRARLR